MIIYPTRYRAEKARRRVEEVVVKVCGGFALMTHRDYYIWKRQK